ncbi:MAG: hypothetical protein ACYCTZ_00255 [Candidatus Dormibacteria bacterium]
MVRAADHLPGAPAAGVVLGARVTRRAAMREVPDQAWSARGMSSVAVRGGHGGRSPAAGS